MFLKFWGDGSNEAKALVEEAVVHDDGKRPPCTDDQNQNTGYNDENSLFRMVLFHNSIAPLS